ncbi:MAG: M28 family peptidase [Candidatus Marinimicrobia bacterium]|nr:M28 family peptidase [Candidatus Neomarinimicrobiota bacterium]
MLVKLKNDVEALAAPGTRKVGSTGHKQARTYISNQLNMAGLIPYSGDTFELPYQIESENYTNIAGVLPGSSRQLPPLMLVAHYDTCGDQPGADDNAASIAVWLLVLEWLKQSERERDILFLFPDAEEPPRFLTDHMGSTNFYLTQRVGDIHAGLVLDLIGHDVPVDGMEDLIFIFGAEGHKSLATALLETSLPVGLRNIATLNRYVGDLSDHSVLRKNNIPYLFFTCGRWKNYHQESDRPENLNYAKMERIAQYLLELVEQLAKIEFDPAGLDHDPVEMEIKLLERAIGPYLKEMSIPLNGREDIQQFVLAWIRAYQL